MLQMNEITRFLVLHPSTARQYSSRFAWKSHKAASSLNLSLQSSRSISSQSTACSVVRKSSFILVSIINWYPRRESNPRHFRYERNVATTELQGYKLVPVERFELSWPLGRQGLKLLRIPFHQTGLHYHTRFISRGQHMLTDLGI